MPIERDFAFVVDARATAVDLMRAAQAADRKFVARVDIFDVYSGAGVPEGKKSVGVSVVLQPRDKTLTEAEIEAIAGRIVAEVEKRTGAKLRG
jgi:phenylalanyl-tRNA synthetase beta chain